MSFKHLDVENALRRVADRKIEEAMREGKFDNLPGAVSRWIWIRSRLMKGPGCSGGR